MATTTSVTLHNDDPHDLFVTLQDLNTPGSNELAIPNAGRINHDESVRIDGVLLDQDGKCKIKWVATDVDDGTKVKSPEPLTLDENEIVDVNLFGI